VAESERFKAQQESERERALLEAEAALAKLKDSSSSPIWGQKTEAQQKVWSDRIERLKNEETIKRIVNENKLEVVIPKMDSPYEEVNSILIEILKSLFF
jgi:hypothetical protein